MALPARPDTRLDRLARAQHGLVDVSQRTDHALDRRQLAVRVARGSLIRVDTGVYRTWGAPVTWEQRQLAACLAGGAGAVASHRAAARLWGLASPPEVVEVTVPYRRAPAPTQGVLHRSTDLRPGDVTRRRRIPVTNPIRTVGDLGAVAPDLVPGAIERGLVLGLFGLAGLWRLVDDLGRPGRRGIGVLRRALEDRALGDAPTRSVLEPVFAALAGDTGLAVEYQHRVHVDGHAYDLDFAIPDALVAIEVDGLEAHASRAALDHDLDRQNRLVLAGWHLLRYTATHLVRRRGAIRREVTALVAARRAALAAAGDGRRADGPVRRVSMHV